MDVGGVVYGALNPVKTLAIDHPSVQNHGIGKGGCCEDRGSVASSEVALMRDIFHVAKQG